MTGWGLPVKPGTHKEYPTRVEHLNTFVLNEDLKWNLQLSVMDATILIYMHFAFSQGTTTTTPAS